MNHNKQQIVESLSTEIALKASDKLFRGLSKAFRELDIASLREPFERADEIISNVQTNHEK